MDRNNGAAKYNSMTVEASRRVGSLNFDAHWTWAHNMNNMGNLEDPYAPLYWNRDFQAKQRLVLNWNYDLPFGRGRRFLSNVPRFADEVLGGWKLYWVTFLQGGQYFSPYFSGSDPSNTNTYGGLPDRLANGNLPPGHHVLGFCEVLSTQDRRDGTRRAGLPRGQDVCRSGEGQKAPAARHLRLRGHERPSPAVGSVDREGQRARAVPGLHAGKVEDEQAELRG
jgi:hypothetical protein